MLELKHRDSLIISVPGNSVSMCLDDTGGVGDAGAAVAAAAAAVDDDDQNAGCVQPSFQSLHVSVEPSRHLYRLKSLVSITVSTELC